MVLSGGGRLDHGPAPSQTGPPMGSQGSDWLRSGALAWGGGVLRWNSSLRAGGELQLGQSNPPMGQSNWQHLLLLCNGPVHFTGWGCPGVSKIPSASQISPVEGLWSPSLAWSRHHPARGACPTTPPWPCPGWSEPATGSPPQCRHGLWGWGQLQGRGGMGRPK